VEICTSMGRIGMCCAPGYTIRSFVFAIFPKHILHLDLFPSCTACTGAKTTSVVATIDCIAWVPGDRNAGDTGAELVAHAGREREKYEPEYNGNEKEQTEQDENVHCDECFGDGTRWERDHMLKPRRHCATGRRATTFHRGPLNIHRQQHRPTATTRLHLST
jgi:hypothetical protein